MTCKWYPVIDYVKCIECGICVEKCPHRVYDITKSPSPVVKNPMVCVEHCHGCGNRCPVGAITYLGDDTGWTPPTGNYELPVNMKEFPQGKENKSCCSCEDDCCDV